MASRTDPQRDPSHLHALVDMGSNGIRFSISSLAPPAARIMPTLYQHRVAISLYDAQHDATTGERVSIPEHVIQDVVGELVGFKSVCGDFGIDMEEEEEGGRGSVRILATEATRTAPNGAELRSRIEGETGWTVEVLGKEEEGRVGGLGVGSSLPEEGTRGLVMDLGGGSVQLSWIVKDKEGGVKMPGVGAVSLPYGAAAMMGRLQGAEREGRIEDLEVEIKGRIKEAYEKLDVPRELEEEAEKEGGFTLYLSGGGFRGWGYVLMSRHPVQPYPIPIINGFKASRESFLSTTQVKVAAAHTLDSESDSPSIFRVSDRRASQVPAVAFLISALASTLPQVKTVRFCQGGVREGHLFSTLPPEIRGQNPLVVATQPFAPDVSSSIYLASLLSSSLPDHPSPSSSFAPKSVFTTQVLTAFTNTLFAHASHSKDIAASSALRSTTTGILANVHGVLHESRALLALLLCARWGGDVPPTDAEFKKNLEKVLTGGVDGGREVGEWVLWWVGYVGRVAGALIEGAYPAGVVPIGEREGKGGKVRLGLEAGWARDEKGREILRLRVRGGKGEMEERGREVEKVGKRKRWIGGREGKGYRVEVVVVVE